MSERYSRLFSLPENLYTEGAPVIIAAGALLKDSQTGRVLAQLKLRNISPKAIKAAAVCLLPLNTVGQPLGEAIRYDYLDLSSTRDTDFGSKSAILMPDITTRSFNAAVVEVIFTDNSVWNANEAAWEPLKSPEALTSRLDSEMVKQFQMEYGSRAENFFLEQKDLWYCVCGAVNRRGEFACHKCNRTETELRNVNMNVLRQNKEARLTRERDWKEKEAAAERERKKAAIAKAEKIGKIAAIAALLIIIVIILAVKIPPIVRARQEEKARLNAYNSAIALIDAESYDEAIAILQDLAGYRDSAQQIQIAEQGKQEMLNADAYAKAVALLEEKDYEGAISAFRALGEYRDSANLLTESRYQFALESMHQKYYKTAAVIFEELDDYADSKAMACECEYLYAMELIEQEDYSGAYSALQIVPEYKDAAEYLSHMYMVPQNITCVYSTEYKEFFHFGYNSDGKMSNAYCDATYSSGTTERNSNCTFDEDGILTRLDFTSGMWYTYASAGNGTVIKYERDTLDPCDKFNEYGNIISFFVENQWHECTTYEYDEYANEMDHSTNVYGAAGDHQEMNLQTVCYSIGNLTVQSSFSYTYIYLPNETADMDLIWKNVRIICGKAIWFD